MSLIFTKQLDLISPEMLRRSTERWRKQSDLLKAKAHTSHIISPAVNVIRRY